MSRSLILRFSFIFLFAFLLLAFPSPSFGVADVYLQPSVEVDINNNSGPQFNESDQSNIQECLYDVFSSKFPLDFLPPEFDFSDSDDSSCPQISLFDNDYEACWLVDIYNKIRPAIVLGLFVNAILTL